MLTSTNNENILQWSPVFTFVAPKNGVKSRNIIHLCILLGAYRKCINLWKMQNKNNCSNDDRSDDNNSANECEFQIVGRRELVQHWIMVAGPWPLFMHKTVANHCNVWCGTTWWYNHYNTLVMYAIKMYKHVTFCALKITKYYSQIQICVMCGFCMMFFALLCSGNQKWGRNYKDKAETPPRKLAYRWQHHIWRCGNSGISRFLTGPSGNVIQNYNRAENRWVIT